MQMCNSLLQTMNIKVELENNMESFLVTNAKKLNEVGIKLNTLVIDENNLMYQVEDIIGESQSILEKLELAIVEVNDNFYKSITNKIEKAIEEKKQQEKKQIEIENQIKYLEGKLELTRRKKNKRKIEEQIKELNIQLTDLLKGEENTIVDENKEQKNIVNENKEQENIVNENKDQESKKNEDVESSEVNSDGEKLNTGETR